MVCVEEVAPPRIVIEAARKRLGISDPGWGELAVAIGLETSQSANIRRWHNEDHKLFYAETIRFLALAGFLTAPAERLLLGRSSEVEAADALRRIETKVPRVKRRLQAERKQADQ